MRGPLFARFAGVAALGVIAAVLPAGSGSAAVRPASLRLLSVMPTLTVVRAPGNGQLVLEAPFYVAATNGPFELDALYSCCASRITVYPTQRDSKGTHRRAALTTRLPVAMASGLPEFFDSSVTDANGKVLVTGTSPFCPGSGFRQSRVDATGPERPTFPFVCGAQLTRGAVWGIDKGWASETNVALDGSNLPDGTYTLTVAVDPSYVKQLGIASASSRLAFTVTISTTSGPATPASPAARGASAAGQTGEGALHADTRGTAVVGADQNGLPNLKALPAYDLGIRNAVAGRDYLDFSATIWNAGTGPLVIEGFRNGAATTMPATQFVYQNGVAVRSAAIGSFEFDRRPGHNHWHFEDFAQYDLLNASGARVLLSGKQSFCLSPDYPIDLTLLGAEWQPDVAGLFSACAGEDSIWLRESLPVGWGDTYRQTVAGQSFDITDTANGTYQVRVTTNPFQRIFEASYADNTSVRTVTLGGTTGARTFN